MKNENAIHKMYIMNLNTNIFLIVLKNYILHLILILSVTLAQTLSLF